METLIALNILMLSPNSKILTRQLSICAFCSFKIKFQFIVEVGRGKEWNAPHTNVQLCYRCCNRHCRWGHVSSVSWSMRNLLLLCSECSAVSPTLMTPDLCTLASLMHSFKVFLDLPWGFDFVLACVRGAVRVISKYSLGPRGIWERRGAGSLFFINPFFLPFSFICNPKVPPQQKRSDQKSDLLPGCLFPVVEKLLADKSRSSCVCMQMGLRSLGSFWEDFCPAGQVWALLALFSPSGHKIVLE